ncbi:PadR family transcriptional regulator [bacterium]|nr:PadR family transcriptional regulator [bacterium]
MIEILILFSLLKRDLTMYSIHKRIEDYFKAFTNPSFGALKPALVRLENKGFIETSKHMSEGGKLSVFYSVTSGGTKELRSLLLKSFSSNPLQFISDAKVKLCCSSFLNGDDRKDLYAEIKRNALLHKANAEIIMNNEYTEIDFYQRIVLDNTICEYNNFISMVEGFEKDARNS